GGAAPRGQGPDRRSAPAGKRMRPREPVRHGPALAGGGAARPSALQLPGAGRRAARPGRGGPRQPTDPAGTAERGQAGGGPGRAVPPAEGPLGGPPAAADRGTPGGRLAGAEESRRRAAARPGLRAVAPGARVLRLTGNPQDRAPVQAGIVRPAPKQVLSPAA